MMKQPIKKKEKEFDTVKMMREIRDRLSREMMHMTHDEKRAYMKRLRAEGPVKKAA
jgi:hypothetical protein